MRLDCPPTRMNPSTSNMLDNMLLLSSNLGYSEGGSLGRLKALRIAELDIMKSVKTSTLALLALVAILAGSVSALGQTVVKTNASAKAFYPLEDLRPGMKGIARTV